MAEPTTATPAADPAVTVVPPTPDPREVKWQELRVEMKTRLLSCPDCQKVARSMLALMDLIVEPPPDPEEAKPKRTLRDEGNATVTIIPATPSPGGAGQGREVAPGVVIIDPVKKKD